MGETGQNLIKMVLKEKLTRDLNSALKEQLKFKADTLRQLLAVILNKEKEKRYRLSKSEPGLTEEDLKKKSLLENEEVIKVIVSEVKKRKEAISEFKKAERKDLAAKEEEEMKILLEYLPEQLSPEEIKKLAREVIKKIGAESPQDIGRVMRELIPQIKGRAEGALVSRIVGELLSSE